MVEKCLRANLRGENRCGWDDSWNLMIGIKLLLQITCKKYENGKRSSKGHRWFALNACSDKV